MTSALRVLFGIGSLAGGGSERQLTQLLIGLDRQRIDPVVCLNHDLADPALRQAVTEADIPIFSVGPTDVRRELRPLVYGWRWWRIVRCLRPDIVYAWLEESAMFAVPAARLSRLPVIVARRNVSGARAETNWAVRGLVRGAERRADIVTTNSEAVLEAARERGIERSRIRLVRNGRPVSPPTPPPRGETICVGYVARFRPEKGHRRLLEVLALLQTHRRWHITLAGDGPQLEEIRQLVTIRHLHDQVTFAGLVEDIPAFWARQHIAALFSDHEGSPNALIEAAAAARPIVGTRVGGIPEICSPPGLRCAEPDDLSGLAAALASLIDDETERERAGLAASRCVSRRFDVQANIDGHTAAIFEALDGGAGKRVRSLDFRTEAGARTGEP